MNGQCWAKLETIPTNLDVTTTISFRRKRWLLQVKGKDVLIKAFNNPHINYPIGNHSAYALHEQTLNGIAGHARNIIYLSFGVNMRWGYESCGGEHMSSGFPSIHQQTITEHSSKKFESSKPTTEIAYLETVARSRRKGVSIMLNYFRRAQELDELQYDSESFLNFYKILECFYELGKGSESQKKLYARFAIKGRGKDKDQPRPSLKSYSSNQIFFTSCVLAGAGYAPNVRRANVLFLLRIVAIRNNWNVGHKIFRYNPYDTYDSIGQHSDEFRHVMIENIYLETMCKFFILKYINPARFKLSNSTGRLSIELC